MAEKWGERPVAFVRTREPISADALVEWSLAHLDKYQRVAAIVNHERDFPRNALGKVQKNLLAESYTKRISE